MTGSSEINRKIILEDGTEYYGSSFGAGGDRILEIVFNTSMTGYQEIMSDPSYTDQAVVMTYPLIGNYGMAEDDYESLSPSVGALVVREYNDEPSNFRSVATLGEVMARFGIVPQQNWCLTTQAILVGLCFASGLAPVSGKFGFPAGAAAGFLHATLVMSVPLLHGGFCLYNGGFTCGIVAFVLIPVIECFAKAKAEKN